MIPTSLQVLSAQFRGQQVDPLAASHLDPAHVVFVGSFGKRVIPVGWSGPPTCAGPRNRCRIFGYWRGCVRSQNGFARRRRSPAAKHGVGLGDAVRLEWTSGVEELDERFDYGEVRIKTLAHLNGRIFACIHTLSHGRFRKIYLRKPMCERSEPMTLPDDEYGTPDEENPEWTDEDFVWAVWAKDFARYEASVAFLIGRQKFLNSVKAAGECPIFCVWGLGSMLPERSKDDDDFRRGSGRVAEGLRAA